jgi:Protein of unknown function (DUF2550)
VSAELALALGQIALALVVAAAAGLVLRRRIITRRGGVVECVLRSRVTGRWQHGLAEYRTAELRWHRSLSLRLRPHCAFDRRELVVIRSQLASAGDTHLLGPGTVIVTCQARPRSARVDRPGEWAVPDVFELAMSRGALTGYLAWLEAAPAGYLGEAS